MHNMQLTMTLVESKQLVVDFLGLVTASFHLQGKSFTQHSHKWIYKMVITWRLIPSLAKITNYWNSQSTKYLAIKANLTQINTEVRKSSGSIKFCWLTIFNPNFNLRSVKTIRIQP